jgi:hypothetical protein
LSCNPLIFSSGETASASQVLLKGPIARVCCYTLGVNLRFSPVPTITHKETNVADIYMREVAYLHGIPKKIISDRDPNFTSKFWKGLFKEF